MIGFHRLRTESSGRQFFLGVTLFALVLSAYLLTYRGMPMSGDEVFIFDSIESLARRGYLERTYEFYTVGMDHVAKDFSGSPWPNPLQEPLATILGVPLFWVAQSLSGVGTMHVVWLFNIFLTALAVVSLYCIALMHGFPSGAAWVGAILFGLGTIAWFYSRLLFREPTMMLFVLWAYALASLIQPYWQKGRLPWHLVLLMLLCFLGALLTKAVSILLLPGLIVLLFPPIEFIKRRWRGIVWIGLMAMIMLVIVMVVMSGTSISRRYDLDQFDRLQQIDRNFVIESLLGYQIGLSRSIWLYSPVLLVGIWGAWLLLREGRWRLVVAPAVGVLLMSLWYGIALRVDWSGGWGWGPRYMLPMVAVMMLWVFPALDYVRARASRMGFVAVGMVGAAGIGIQLLGMANPLSNYYTDLFRANKIYDFPDFVESEWHWMAGNWQLKWSPIYYHLDRVDIHHLDMAWRVADPQGLTVILAVTVLFIALVATMIGLRAVSIRRSLLIGYPVLSLILIMSVIGTGLRSLRNDPRYVGELTDVRELVAAMDTSVRSDDIVFLDREQYLPIFMNYFKTPALVAALPYSRSERYGRVDPEANADAAIEEQLGQRTVYALNWSEGRYHRLWLVASSSPFEAEKIRPIEHYLAQRYYPINEITMSYRARAISFLPFTAPTGDPATVSDAVFGDQLVLIGYDLPDEDEYVSGDVVPLSLVWQPRDQIEKDYNVGVYLVDSAGRVHSQRDGLPQGTFGHMSKWEAGVAYRDNHGLLIPEELIPGEYRVLVAIYDWKTGQRLPATAISGEIEDSTVSLAVIAVR